jgi:hypothetical protein
MKEQIKLTPMTAEYVALCYQSIKAARDYASSIGTDPQTHDFIKGDFKVIADILRTPLARIEKRIPKQTREVFNKQIKETDSIRLENIRAIYVRLLPEKQVMAEIMMEGILSGEIEFSSNATP